MSLKLCETCNNYVVLYEGAGLCELCDHLVTDGDSCKWWEGEEDED